MNTNIQTLLLVTLLPAAALTFTGCRTESAAPQGSTTVAFQPGVPGGVMTEKFQETATVTALDPATRKVTLVTTDGNKTTFIAGPEVANFSQIEIGDQVKATVTERVSVYVPKPGESASDLAATALALAPLGEKPGGVLADTDQYTAKVTGVSLWRHTATLQFPDGSRKTFKVRPDVSLSKDTIGTEVVIRTTQAVAVSVEKP